MANVNKDNYLTVYPIGGFGEIGLNCLMLETNNNAVLIDCGLMFPDNFQYGVDVVIPSLGFILKKKNKLKGLVLTHGHEDHIGALPWLLKDLNVPIYGSDFTLALVGHKMREFSFLNIPSNLEFVKVGPRDRIEIGDFAFTFFPVCHSIIQGFALGIETPIGKLFHTGDFKIDRNPLRGHKTDLEGIAKFSCEDVLVMFSDSTNVELEGFALTENEIKNSLFEIFKQAKGRILVTLFSSHIQRIQEIFDLSKKVGRKMGVSGRSLLVNIEIARKLGQLELDDEFYLSLDEVSKYPDEEVVLLVAGSQGEPMSALTRLSEGTHKHLKIHKGDMVIMSSRIIPGNTKAINRVINNLYRLGAEVLYEKVEAVHASGHAHSEELKIMLNTVKPKFFIPTHGEYRHLVKHANLAKECGVAPERVIILEDGQPVTFLKNSVRFEDRFEANFIMVDGKGVGDVDDSVIKERQLLADEGLVIVLLVLNKKGNILMEPEVRTKGFIFEQQYSHIIEEAKSITMDVYSGLKSKGSLKKIKKRVKNSLRKYFKKTLERDPVIVPIVITI